MPNNRTMVGREGLGGYGSLGNRQSLYPKSGSISWLKGGESMGRDIIMTLRIGPTTPRELVAFLGTMARYEQAQKEKRDASRNIGA